MSGTRVCNNSILPKFAKCLESLPNLHTLEIGRADDAIRTPIKNALKRVKLPQIKALILSPAAYPLLRRCHNVEDIVCVIGNNGASYDELIGSIASNRDSKIKRLAIPLVLGGNPPRK